MDVATLDRLCREAAGQHRPLIHAAGRTRLLDWTRNPRPRASFGLIDDWVFVEPGLATDFARLVIPFRPERLGPVRQDTLRLFRADARTKRLEKVPDAVTHVASPVVHAAIDRPGWYGLVGLNDNRLVADAIRQLCAVRTDLPDSATSAARDRVCEQILCTADPGELAGALVQPAHPGETVCERCHGIELPDFPECDILDEPGARPARLVRWENLGPVAISGAMRDVSSVRGLVPRTVSSPLAPLSDGTDQLP